MYDITEAASSEVELFQVGHPEGLQNKSSLNGYGKIVKDFKSVYCVCNYFPKAVMT